jgi:hypothetical protein
VKRVDCFLLNKGGGTLIEIVVFVVSLLAAVLAVGLLRERRLRLALAMLLKRLLERWRNGHADHVDVNRTRGDHRGGHGL